MNPTDAPPLSSRVTVVDVDIKFGTMVWLMIKASFAAAIATAVTSVLWAAIGVFIGGLMVLGFMVLMTAFAALGIGMAGVGASLPPPDPAASHAPAEP